VLDGLLDKTADRSFHLNLSFVTMKIYLDTVGFRGSSDLSCPWADSPCRRPASTLTRVIGEPARSHSRTSCARFENYAYRKRAPSFLGQVDPENKIIPWKRGG